MTTKKSSGSTHFTRILLWAITAIIIVTLGLLAYTYLRSNADTISPDDSVTISSTGAEQTFSGNGLVRLLCPNPRSLSESTTAKSVNFIATGTVGTGTRGTITNSSHREYGSALTVTTNSTSTSVAQGETTRLFPSDFTATLKVNTSYCDIRFTGIGDLKVKAVDGDITGLVYGNSTIENQPGVVAATTPVVLQTTVKKEACTEKVTLSGKGEKSNLESDLSAPEITKTGTIESLPTYSLTVKDSLTGNSRSIIVTDKNQDKKGKLDVTVKCDGTLTLKQTD